MYWSPELKEKLSILMADTPPRHKEYIQPKIEAAVELMTQKMGKSDPDEDSLIHAYILCVPRHLRDGIVQVLTEHNYDMLYFRAVFDDPVITDGMLNRKQAHKPSA